MSFVYISLCVFLSAFHQCYSLTTLSLNGSWIVSSLNHDYNMTGTVPGSMYTALLDNKYISDPYYRKNDGELRWVGEDDWTYSRTFTVPPALLQQQSVVLVCEGLDTVATVRINNQVVGTANNQFVRYVYNIKSVIVVGVNTITIQFTSAVTYTQHQADAYPYLVLPGVTMPTQHGIYHVNMIRKSQCSFSWDWGPAFATQAWYQYHCYKLPVCRKVCSRAGQAISVSGFTALCTARVPWDMLSQFRPEDAMLLQRGLGAVVPQPRDLSGPNTITINFRSATKYATEQAGRHSYPVYPSCVPPEYHGACGANFVRKMQCSFSWDWGPSFPTQGIWKSIYIQGYSTVAIRDVTTEASKHLDGSWQLVVDVFMDVQNGTVTNGKIEVKLDNTTVDQTTDVILTSSKSKVRVNITIPASAGIREWWPNGYGAQALYDLYVFYSDTTGAMQTRKVRIGFRTVELVQDYVSVNKSLGRTFYFRINGRPVFFKGSNWVPADSFQERITRQRLYTYLKSAADAHMNSMRVWGGGVYESDTFYELADELGIMIWQDFMFACSMYPTDPAFLDTVSQEVTHQLRRLKHHPSIVALSGNNENEKALVQDWYGTAVNYTRYKSDYLTLYIDVIRRIVEQEDTSRPFLSSSPSNGLQTQQEGWVSKEPYSTLYGDIHEYKYLVPFFDPSQYRIPRFSSEYGLQSYPSLESLKSVYEPVDMDYWGDLNEWRNHHPFGNVQMMAEAIQYVKLPNSPDRKQKFDDLIYVTQITQSIGMKTETEHYRRWQNRLDDQGQGNTMGALYWMLADIWQAPTWASLEYGGTWKMLHYYAKEFFAPTLVSPYFDDNNVNVYIVVDELPVREERHPVDYTLHFRPKSNPRPFSVFDINSWSRPIEDFGSLSSNHIIDTEPSSFKRKQSEMSPFSGKLYLEMYSWDNMAPLHTWSVDFQINSTAQSVFRRPVSALMQEAGCMRSVDCFLYFHLGDKDGGPTNWLPLNQFNAAEGMQKAHVGVVGLDYTSEQNVFNVSLATNAIAPFVWVEALGVPGRFSNNGFLMIQHRVNVLFYSWKTIELVELGNTLRVRSLMDVYHDENV